MSTGNQGRLEIFHNGVWGTICDDNFDRSAASVACRQMGLPYRYAMYKHRAFFGEGSGQIWLSDVECRGDERMIEQCDLARGWGHHYCQHFEDAGVICR